MLGNKVNDERNNIKEYKSEDYIEYFEKLDISTKTEYVGTDSVFGRMVKIYRLNWFNKKSVDMRNYILYEYVVFVKCDKKHLNIH